MYLFPGRCAIPLPALLYNLTVTTSSHFLYRLPHTNHFTVPQNQKKQNDDFQVHWDSLYIKQNRGTITRMNSSLSSPRSMDMTTTHSSHTDFQTDMGNMETTEVCSRRTFGGSHFKRPALVSGLTHLSHWELRSYSEVSHQQIHKDSGRQDISKSYLISGFQCIY